MVAVTSGRLIPETVFSWIDRVVQNAGDPQAFTSLSSGFGASSRDPEALSCALDDKAVGTWPASPAHPLRRFTRKEVHSLIRTATSRRRPKSVNCTWP